MLYNNRSQSDSSMNKKKDNLTISQLDQTGCQNIIKITEFGYQTLSAVSDWGGSPSNLLPHSQNKPKNSFTNSSKIQNEHDYGKSTGIYKNRELSRKTLRAFNLWSKTQQAINENLGRQMIKLESEKSKQYEWPKLSSVYKKDIQNIFDFWSNKKKEEDFRASKRLKEIYNKKYIREDEQSRSKTCNKKLRELKLRLI